ncbi:right-handed parallel beta-helix repeat-containing protein [Sorangium sp. So ce295]|uniref:pectate lyase family protein n=1 Tax=Sorangium sp. So ce295 TaxID=3133295 RepID=UPI003F5E4C2F
MKAAVLSFVLLGCTGCTFLAGCSGAASSPGPSDEAAGQGAAGGSTPGAGGHGGGTAGAQTGAGGSATTGSAGSTGSATTGSAGGAGAATAGSASAATTGSAGGAGGSGPVDGVGTILKVTNLDADGPGSLRQAIETRGPRTIVFEVGGIIDLNKTRLDITEPFVTIAGQTAPSPGVTLIRGGMKIRTHDVRIRHLRFRMGDAGAAPASGFEPDVTTDGASAYNIVIDHCSVAWGVDENLSVSGPRFDGPDGTSRRVTLSNNIIAEGLLESIHEKGSHSMGTLVHDRCTDVTVVGNLYAHNNERNPWYKGFATGAIVNNVVYNPGKWAMRLGPVLKEWESSGVTPEPPRVSIVGNYMRHGANTLPGLPMIGTNSLGSAYLEDNIAVDALGAAAPIASPDIIVLAEKPAWPDGLVALPAASVLDAVLAHAGARPRDRDEVDLRIVEDVLSGDGMFVNSQDEVGGYPTAAPTSRPLDAPTEDIEGWLDRLADEIE